MLIRKEEVPGVKITLGKKTMCKAIRKKSAEERKQEMNQLMEQLENGVKAVFDGEEYANYLRTMNKFRHYSINNQLLIWCQCPQATAVAGFNDWKKKFGRTVKKGEKGIRILAPVPVKVKVGEDEEDENGIIHHAGEDMKQILLFRPVVVFDVSQTEGKPLPEFEVKELTGKVSDYESVLDAIIEVSPCDVSFEEITTGAKGYYSILANKVVINTGMSEEQTLKTCLHEIAHAVLHNRERSGEEKKDKPTQEVEAESIAFMVANALGIDTSSYSFKYVATWSNGKTVPELKASLELIKATATELTDRLELILNEVKLEEGGSTSSEGENIVCVRM